MNVPAPTTMLDLNHIRREFADHLAADPTRFRMDSALAHVVTLAYRQGIKDGQGGATPFAADSPPAVPHAGPAT